MLSNTKTRLVYTSCSAAGGENEPNGTVKKRGQARLHNVTNQLSRICRERGQVVIAGGL